MPVDYSKAKIYKLITIHNPNLVYYGSTVNELSKSKYVHKSHFKNGVLTCTSSKLFELGLDDVEIVLVEIVNCNNKEELHARERFYIENNNCVNKVIPCRTQKEYKIQNKEKIKIRNTKYNEYNKENIKIKHANYYVLNKEKIKEYYRLYYLKQKIKGEKNLPPFKKK